MRRWGLYWSTGLLRYTTISHWTNIPKMVIGILVKRCYIKSNDGSLLIRFSNQQVHDKFELMKETLFLTVNLIDRFLSKQTVVRKKLQLVGLVAMLLACKYEEVSVPVVGDLILISDKAYTRDEVLEMVIVLLWLLYTSFLTIATYLKKMITCFFSFV